MSARLRLNLKYLTLTAALLWLESRPAFGQIASCAPSPAGIIGWWSGNGNADDRTGLNHGVLQGGVTFEAGQVSQAFSFHGGVDAVMIPASASLDVGSGPGLTLEGWIYPNDLSTRSPLIEWNHGGTNFIEWGVHLWILQAFDFGLPPGSLFANLAEVDGTPHYIMTPGYTLQTSVWQHVALTYDKTSGQGRLYVNGTIAADVGMGTFEPETGYDLFFGRRPAGDKTLSYNGLLDEVSFYNRALSEGEIANIFNAGSEGKCPAPPALLDLISLVSTSNVPRNVHPLLASLLAARDSMTLANAKSAINQLRAFQHKVRAQVAPDAAALATTFTLASQQVIDVIDPLHTLRTAAAIPQPALLQPPAWRPHGKVRLYAKALPGSFAVFQFSTDLVHWFDCGKAAEVTDGLFVMDQAATAGRQQCSYRLMLLP
jgi:hypothetical protein